jgi:predicted transglutaminase-like cysteine proteinase
MNYNLRKKLGSGNLGPEVSDVARAANAKVSRVRKTLEDAEALSAQRGGPGTAAEYWANLSKDTKGADFEERLKLVHQRVNRYPYAKDNSDYWKTPAEFLKPAGTGGNVRAAGGDCEDYALMKYALLAQAGVPKENMRILAMRNTTPSLPGHAVLVVDDPRADKRYYLDNQAAFGEVSSGYKPMYFVDDQGFCEF